MAGGPALLEAATARACRLIRVGDAAGEALRSQPASGGR